MPSPREPPLAPAKNLLFHSPGLEGHRVVRRSLFCLPFLVPLTWSQKSQCQPRSLIFPLKVSRRGFRSFSFLRTADELDFLEFLTLSDPSLRHVKPCPPPLRACSPYYSHLPPGLELFPQNSGIRDFIVPSPTSENYGVPFPL